MAVTAPGGGVSRPVLAWLPGTRLVRWVVMDHGLACASGVVTLRPMDRPGA